VVAGARLELALLAEQRPKRCVSAISPPGHIEKTCTTALILKPLLPAMIVLLLVDTNALTFFDRRSIFYPLMVFVAVEKYRIRKRLTTNGRLENGELIVHQFPTESTIGGDVIVG